jgi:hypothetical protein
MFSEMIHRHFFKLKTTVKRIYKLFPPPLLSYSRNISTNSPLRQNSNSSTNRPQLHNWTYAQNTWQISYTMYFKKQILKSRKYNASPNDQLVNGIYLNNQYVQKKNCIPNTTLYVTARVSMVNM